MNIEEVKLNTIHEDAFYSSVVAGKIPLTINGYKKFMKLEKTKNNSVRRALANWTAELVKRQPELLKYFKGIDGYGGMSGYRTCYTKIRFSLEVVFTQCLAPRRERLTAAKLILDSFGVHVDINTALPYGAVFDYQLTADIVMDKLYTGNRLTVMKETEGGDVDYIELTKVELEELVMSIMKDESERREGLCQ
jgi:hypothetical protein